MPTVHADIIAGNSGDLTIRGWEFSRVFKVADLVGAGYEMLVEAVDATGIPFGASHPTIPDAFAVRFTPESIESVGNAVTVIITYRQFNEDYRVNLGNRAINFETTNYVSNTDTGELSEMVLTYIYPDDYPHDTSKQGLTDTQGVRVSIKTLDPTIVISRTEWVSILADGLSGWGVGVKLTGEMLTDRSLLYSQSLNKSGWNLRPNDDAKRWQCRIDAVSAEDGLAWRVTYTFEYDELHWQVAEKFQDPHTNQPVPDATDPSQSGAAVLFDQFLEQDFTLLELR